MGCRWMRSADHVRVLAIDNLSAGPCRRASLSPAACPQDRQASRRPRAASSVSQRGSSELSAARRGRDREGLLPLGAQAGLFGTRSSQGAGQARGTFEQGRGGGAVSVVFKGVERLGHQ